MPPPSELPAMCAVPIPSSSIRCSKMSVKRSIASGFWTSISGIGGPPKWPCSVGAITSKNGTSSPSTAVQARQVSVNPWISSSGSPLPAR